VTAKRARQWLQIAPALPFPETDKRVASALSDTALQ